MNKELLDKIKTIREEYMVSIEQAKRALVETDLDIEKALQLIIYTNNFGTFEVR